MFEKFADSARSAVVAAQSEAKRLEAQRIHPSHLLLGVLVSADEPLRALLADADLTVDGLRADCAAQASGDALGAEDAAALDTIGIDLDAVKSRLEETFGEGVLDRDPSGQGGAGRANLWGRLGHIPFDKDAKKVLELSLREALARHERVIRAEHVLLGVLRGGDPSATALVEAHVHRDELRRRLVEHLDEAA
ncbi:Clp protease N-terminal domain-containing protein [Rhodococcus sp. NPDC058639]|uniref:Clp protease N-terminal domain-containing protein n=1 Tax=unclassified Rhodococcus (in: high G+C Gram-positive bacteria) TaxID=192944 RepID=UPI00364BB67C